MTPYLGAIVVAGVIVFFVADLRRMPAARVVLSPFWYFSFLFLIAFPVRASFLFSDATFAQVNPNSLTSELYPDAYLVWALVYISFVWLAIFWGRQQTIGAVGVKDGESVQSASYVRVIVVTLAFAVATVMALMVIGDVYPDIFGGVEYQKNRQGAGALWILPEFFVWALFGYCAMRGVRMQSSFAWYDYVLFAAAFALAILISGELNTRRMIAGVILLYIAVIVLRVPRLWPLAACGVVGTVLGAPVLHFLRSIYYAELAGEDYRLNAFILNSFSDYIVHTTSSAFEGAGHTARFIEKATFGQILAGVDQGVTWLFNAGLALVPRGLWESKPLIHGGMEQFHWLYPHMFEGGYAGASIPMSFGVDFAFGFGLPFALVLAFVFGRILGVTERLLWDRSASVAANALSLFIYVFMFNWVRGGTVIIQSVFLFSIPLTFMFGLRETLHAVFGILGEGVGLVGGEWRGGRRVFFYPHAYLRERQLDTVRFWQGQNPVNAGFAKRTTGNNVTREQALQAPRGSWKRHVPLVNMKRRPKDAPMDSLVYVWGGLVSKGPFITDIDNPYALTGYNVFASRLYKPIIKSFLLSPRCLQIRCMSRACQENLEVEYGKRVAAKSCVSYPYIAKRMRVPKEPSAKRCRFLFVSSQFEIKGGKALLNAFRRVSAACPHAELDLVTYLPNEFRAAVDEMPNVRVLEAKMDREILNETCIAQADVLVHPTYMDSFGMVVLEALSYGLPVIATDVYAMSEMVEEGENGFLLKPPLCNWSGVRPGKYFADSNAIRAMADEIDTSGFEQELSDAMAMLANDPELRFRMGVHSLELIDTRFGQKT